MLLHGILWGLWFALHSVFASDTVKRAICNQLPSLTRFYRITYNLFAIVTFSALVWLQGSLEQHQIATLHPIARYLMWSIGAAGLIIAALTFRRYSLTEFTGLDTLERGSSDSRLNVDGLNSVVRHPLYFGTILLLIGYLGLSFTYESLIFVIIAVAYLFIGSALEEQKLIRTFGDQYLDYRKKTPGLIPWFPMRRKAGEKPASKGMQLHQ